MSTTAKIINANNLDTFFDVIQSFNQCKILVCNYYATHSSLLVIIKKKSYYVNLYFEGCYNIEFYKTKFKINDFKLLPSKDPERHEGIKLIDKKNLFSLSFDYCYMDFPPFVWTRLPPETSFKLNILPNSANVLKLPNLDLIQLFLGRTLQLFSYSEINSHIIFFIVGFGMYLHFYGCKNVKLNGHIVVNPYHIVYDDHWINITDENKTLQLSCKEICLEIMEGDSIKYLSKKNIQFLKEKVFHQYPNIIKLIENNENNKNNEFKAELDKMIETYNLLDKKTLTPNDKIRIVQWIQNYFT